MAQSFISGLLASSERLAAQRPWPRYRVSAPTWCDIARKLGKEADLLGFWADAAEVHLALRERGETPCVVSIAVEKGGFPSVGQHHAPAIRLERAIRDIYGHEPVGLRDVRPWLDHGAWEIATPAGAGAASPLRDPAKYDFLPVHGPGLHQIPVGPVHAGIIEPGHFRFTANGEIVVRLEQRLGYVHKGIEMLLADSELARACALMARISGDSTVAYSFAFARAVEAAAGIEAPARAQVLRGVMAELERIANHLGDVGAICNDASFTLLHAYCGIFREQILQASDRAFGHRLMMDRIVPGGVACDIAGEAADFILQTLDEVEPGFAEIVNVYDSTPSMQDRSCTTGIVGRALVEQWAAGGFVGRASGRDFDTRRDLAYAPYTDAGFEVPLFTKGDVDARLWVRVREIAQSMRLLRHWLSELPAGELRIAVPSGAEIAEGVAAVEAFRGDVLVWVRMRGGRVLNAHARDASWFQWPLLEAAIEGNIVADFPLCNKSFNCSYSGHDL